MHARQRSLRRLCSLPRRSVIHAALDLSPYRVQPDRENGLQLVRCLYHTSSACARFVDCSYHVVRDRIVGWCVFVHGAALS